MKKLIIVLILIVLMAGCVEPTPQVVYATALAQNDCITMWNGYRIERCIDTTYDIACYITPMTVSCVKW